MHSFIFFTPPSKLKDACITLEITVMYLYKGFKTNMEHIHLMERLPVDEVDCKLGQSADMLHTSRQRN